jgi:carboxylesterase
MALQRGTREPFRFNDDVRGDRLGALVLHGFSGSPFEVRYLGERLAERGFAVVGPALAGHARGNPADLDATTWQDWYATVEQAFDELRARVRRVAVVGLSMGGLMTLHLARQRQGQVAAIGALSVPLWLPRHLEAAIRTARRGIAVAERVPPLAAALAARGGFAVPKAGGLSDIADPVMRAQNPTMPAMPVRALASLLELMRLVRAELPGVHAPAFVAHARRDHTAPYACLGALTASIGARDLRAVTLEHSFHVVTIDAERERLARLVGDFFEEKPA